LKALFAESGPINTIGLRLGLLSHPLAMNDSVWVVWLGMLTNYLPFMVLPLFTSLEKMDWTLVEAAQDLGASSFQVLRRVLLPLTRPGIVNGLIFVFTPALGEFVIPDLLGGAKVLLVGGLITDQFLKTRDWPFGSAVSLLLMGAVTLTLSLRLRNPHGKGLE
jgi:spermidine/putrescine transport system permease protein